MALTLYNTLSRAKDAFAPIDPNDVRLYVCGPTVYDFAHIGNARPVVVFDVLYRVLRHRYGKGHVTYVRNITDVDDKIIAAAGETGEPIEAITTRYADVFRNDMASLGALPPDVEPKATDHISEMIAMIETLIASGHAYEADGHALFAVSTMETYGALSRHSRDELIAGARVEVAPYKRDPADFVLWKPSDDTQPGWDSPWGRGRPGWHLECSAMSKKHLGETFDIHGGGQDLIFPHHENEIAQSTCAHGGKTFVRHWMHNGYVTVDGEKMAKSAGNFLTVHDLLDKAPGEAIRLGLLTAHYRQPLDFSLDGIEQARGALDRLYGALDDSRDAARDAGAPGGKRAVAALAEPVIAALEDDLNTPRALAEMHELATALNKATASGERAALRAALVFSGDLMGLLDQEPQAWLKGEASSEIDGLVAARAAARAARDFAEADRLRNELEQKHKVVVLDRPDGTTDWRRE